MMMSQRRMLCEIISVLFLPLSQYTLICSYNSFSTSQCRLVTQVLENLVFIPVWKNPSVVELYVLSGDTGCLCSNKIISGHIPIAVFTLIKGSYISDSAVDDTTLKIVLNSVWIRPFHLSIGLTDSGEDQSLR